MIVTLIHKNHTAYCPINLAAIDKNLDLKFTASNINMLIDKTNCLQNLGKGSLWTVDPQYKPNLIQALNRSPFHPVSTLESSYQMEKPPANDRPSIYRLPNPDLFPYLAKKLASTEMNGHTAYTPRIKMEEVRYKVDDTRIKMEDSLDAVDAAAVMLSLKNSQPKNLECHATDFLQVITNSPSQDHTYSAADSENGVPEDGDNR